MREKYYWLIGLGWLKPTSEQADYLLLVLQISLMGHPCGVRTKHATRSSQPYHNPRLVESVWSRYNKRGVDTYLVHPGNLRVVEREERKRLPWRKHATASTTYIVIKFEALLSRRCRCPTRVAPAGPPRRIRKRAPVRTFPPFPSLLHPLPPLQLRRRTESELLGVGSSIC